MSTQFPPIVSLNLPRLSIQKGFDILYLWLTTLEEEKKKLQEKNAELEKQLEGCRRDLLFQKQENVYLKKINELLEKKK